MNNCIYKILAVNSLYTNENFLKTKNILLQFFLYKDIEILRETDRWILLLEIWIGEQCIITDLFGCLK